MDVISGVVVDNQGEPLIGVTIKVSEQTEEVLPTMKEGLNSISAPRTLSLQFRMLAIKLKMSDWGIQIRSGLFWRRILPSWMRWL